MKTARVLVVGVLCVLAGAFAAGCGSSSAGGDGQDPAALVPANAPLYAEATVRPQGNVRADAEAALRKILRTDDPGAKIAETLESASKQEQGVSFKDDVEPWLGDRVGAAVTSLRGGNDADYVFVIASTDDAKASDAIAKRNVPTVKRSYKGVDYRFDAKDGTAAAVIDHRVVIGTEGGLKSAIDASKGDSLAGADGLRAVRSKVAQDRLGLVYLDVQGLVRAIGQSATGDPQLGVLLQSAAGAAPKAIGAALKAQPDALRIDAVSIGTPKSASTGAGGADALAALPAESWLGLGVADLGQTLDRVLQTIADTGGLTGVGVQAALGQFQHTTGLDLRKDVLSWMGDAGVFVAGTSKSDLRGALVITTSDPAKTRRAIAALERFARRSANTHVTPLGSDGFTARRAGGPAMHVALVAGQLIVGVGPKSVVHEAAAPSGQLGSAPAFTDAAARLDDGLRPSFFLDFPQMVKLIEDYAGNDAGYQKAKPYLEAIGAIVGGGRDEGDGVTRMRFAVALR